MRQKITKIALVVDDYDEAIQFYTQKLNFKLLEDYNLSESKRWVVISPQGAEECCILLAKATNLKQSSRVGNQTGGRVFLFLNTDDFTRDYENLLKHKIPIIRGPKIEEYGQVLVFSDLYGNLWDLIGPLPA